MVFIVIVSALLLQALCGSAAAQLLKRPQLLPCGSAPVFNPEITLPASYPYQKLPTLASEYEIIRSSPALPVFSQESLQSFIPQLSQPLSSFPAKTLPSFIPELSYPKPSLPALPVYSEVVVPTRPAILPAPGYPIYDGLKDLVVTGDLPIASTASVNGALPVSGTLQFSGYVPAAGKVSVSCGCGNYPSVSIYY